MGDKYRTVRGFAFQITTLKDNQLLISPYGSEQPARLKTDRMISKTEYDAITKCIELHPACRLVEAGAMVNTRNASYVWAILHN
jgi:hypothetical protein